MSPTVEVALRNLSDTRALATAIAAATTVPMTISLVGSLGTGKTQFVRFFAESLGVSPEEVTSPTYVLLQRYVGKKIIYHFDFYRLDSSEQVWDLGIDELFDQTVLLLIEWADKFPECLPTDHLRIELTHDDANLRTARVTALGVRSSKVLQELERGET